MTSSKLPEELEEKIALKYFAPMCFTKEQAVLMLRNFVNEYGSNLFPEMRSQKEGVMSAEEIMEPYAAGFSKPVVLLKNAIKGAKDYASQFENKYSKAKDFIDKIDIVINDVNKTSTDICNDVKHLISEYNNEDKIL